MPTTKLEAEITGGLEHPGIVPVYSLGQYPDGRPFYAMRFIRGDSLQSAIKEFHQAEVAGRDPGKRAMELRNLLGRFIDVCQAIQYAHDRGVLHRDLKPANIMLGRYGETLVVDWGLAKAVGKNEPTSNEPMLQPASGESSATQSGHAIGTPAYMSPEQAAGRPDLLGPASDVYSLGATLYTLLTGKTAVEAKDLALLLKNVQAGLIIAPRQRKPDTDPALAAICLKAMALLPADRYDSPRALADDIEHWLADEPVSAQAEPLTVRTRRWTRKHRTLVASVAAVVLVATISSIVASILLANVNGQLEDRNQALDTANKQLDTANAGLTAGNERLDVANANLKTTNDDLDAANRGLKITNERLDVANADLKTTNDKLRLARMDAESKRQQAEKEKQVARAVQMFLQYDLLRQADPADQANRVRALGSAGFKTVENPTIKQLLDRAAAELKPEKIGERFPNQPLVQAEILHTMGFTYRGVGDSAKAIAHLERARSLYEKELGLNHGDSIDCLNNLAMGYHDAGKLDLAVPLYEESFKRCKATLGPDDRSTLISMLNLAGGYQAVGKLDQALPLFEETAKLCKATFGADDSQTLNAMNSLAVAYKTDGKLDLALPLYQDTLKRCKATIGDDHPLTLAVMGNLAAGYHAAKKLALAIPLYEETLKFQKEKLGLDHPDTLISMNNLAAGYQATGKLAKAVPLFEDTLKIQKVKLGADHPDTLITMNNLAAAYWRLRKLDRSVPLFEELLPITRRKQGDDHPDTLLVLANLGINYRDAGRLTDAIPHLEEVVEKGRKHAALQPIGSVLVDVYVRAGKKSAGVTFFAERLQESRSKLPPESLQLGSALAADALALLQLQAYPEAEKLLRECVAIRQKKEPAAWTTFHTQSMLGGALLGQKKYADAEPLLLAGYEGIKQRAAKILPKDADRLTDAEGRLAELFEATRKQEEIKLQGKLTGAKTEVVHEVKLTAGKPAVIEMQSKQFDTLLQLKDSKGKLLAENDDIDFANKNLNSRILFIPKEDGVYRIVATSFQQTGRGEYAIIIRQYHPTKSK